MRSKWASWRKTCRIKVMERARGCCEACGERKTLQWAHGFGRRHIVGEPLASSPQLTWGLCQPCHFAYDNGRDAALKERLQVAAASRLCSAFELELVGLSPSGMVREVERLLRGHDQLMQTLLA